MRYYIVSWDNLGVEFFQDITKYHPENWAKEHLFDSIKESKLSVTPMDFNLQALILRAQFNAQRHYEIYVFSSTDDISAEDIEQWFTKDPQGFADWVRDNHTKKIYDNRKTNKDVIV